MSNPNKLGAPILLFRRSVAGRLQIAGWAMCLALTAANAQGLLSRATDLYQRPGQWLSLLIAAVSMVLCLGAIIISWGLPRRLTQLTANMLALAETCGGTAATFAGAGDEIDKLLQAHDVFRESSRHAIVSEANLKAAVENMVEGIVMISADGKVTLHNQKLLAIFGLPAMNATGWSRAEFNAMLVDALRWPQSAQDYLQKQLAEIRCDGHTRRFDVELPDNRILRYSASVLADGNVMSYIEDISEQRAAAASILRLAHYDTLTDLPNRTLFQERLVIAVGASERDPTASATLLLCDLDRFKAINEAFGHPVGDELLRQVTRRMRAQVFRAANMLARLDGDEFAIIYLSHDDPHGAEGLAGRLVACLEQPFEIQGHTVTVGISVGIASAPHDAASADELMIRTGLALNAAKQGGRNMHRCYEPAMSMVANECDDLAILRRAIENEELHLHYQPQVDLRTRRIVGFEALARWDHPDRGAMSPDVFVPLAEKAGLVLALGAWVLRRACTDALGWGDDITIAVNVAPQQLRVEGFVDMVEAVLAQTGLKAARLELEITETTPLHDDEAILTVLRKLASLGVRVSMDDFGTGNTGLSYLHKFRFDGLKIDQSFVKKLGDGKEPELIINAIVELSVLLNLQTVAEGIETEEQATILWSMKCDVGQGFLFGRPAPVNVANSLIAEQNLAKGNLVIALPLRPQSG